MWQTNGGWVSTNSSTEPTQASCNWLRSVYFVTRYSWFGAVLCGRVVFHACVSDQWGAWFRQCHSWELAGSCCRTGRPQSIAASRTRSGRGGGCWGIIPHIDGQRRKDRKQCIQRKQTHILRERHWARGRKKHKVTERKISRQKTIFSEKKIKTDKKGLKED